MTASCFKSHPYAWRTSCLSIPFTTCYGIICITYILLYLTWLIFSGHSQEWFQLSAFTYYVKTNIFKIYTKTESVLKVALIKLVNKLSLFCIGSLLLFCLYELLIINIKYFPGTNQSNIFYFFIIPSLFFNCIFGK